jgi:ribosomal protein S18 acetylase RimI-like enzyme
MENRKPFRISLVRSLRGNSGLQAERLFHEIFWKDAKEDVREKYCSTPFAYLLATEKGSLIGVAKMFRRKISYGKAKITLGGLGEVCTREDKRRMGVATALVNRGMEELKSHGCDVAYLCTDIRNPVKFGLYKKAGFVALGKPYTYIIKSGKRHTETNGMIAPLRSGAKFRLMMEGKETLDIGSGNW